VITGWTPGRVALVVHPTRPIDDALRTLERWTAEHGVPLLQVAVGGKHRAVAESGTLQPGDLVVAIGGDGTVLAALRAAAATKAPVLGIAYGSLGALSAVAADRLVDALDRVWAGDWTPRSLPGLAVDAAHEHEDWAINDIVVVRRGAGQLVAEVAVDDELYVRLAGDGLVVATPQGSTGYNLANGGPVLAWGVEGYVVSFIAPHSLTARALVVAPDDLLTINNASREEAVEVHVDGRPACELPAGEDIYVEFGRSYATLAQLPGASFYHRLRERFGRLAK